MNKIVKRHQAILELLAQTPLTTIGALSAQLQVSGETIRKDLKLLAAHYDLVQTHGGVALRENNSSEVSFDQRLKINSRSKQAIGRRAAGLVTNDDVIFLENATTALALMKALCHRNHELELSSVVIVTTSFQIQAMVEQAFAPGAGPRLFFVGGWVDHQQHATSGEYTINGLKHLHIKKCFLSAAAIGADLQLMGYTEFDSSVQKYMLANAEKIIVLAEKGKYPKYALIQVGNLQMVDQIVTDIHFPAELQGKLKLAGTEVLVPH